MNFGQEIKDFLSAYKAGNDIRAKGTDEEYKKALTDATKQKTERENDPDTLELAAKTAQADLELKRANIGRTQAATAGSNANTAYLQQLRKQRMAVPVNPDEGIGSQIAGSITGAAPQGALPTGVPMDNTATVRPFALPEGYSRGGVVKGYADGGLVEEDEELDAPAMAVPAQVTPPSGGGMTDVSAQSRQRGSLSTVSPQLVHDATKAGLTYGQTALGLNSQGGVLTPAQRQRAMQYASGFGALPEKELGEVKKAVDPEGKLTEAQRNMAALGAVYQFHVAKGQPEKAQRAAFQVLQAYRMDAQRYAAIAAHAAEGGNLDVAAKAALKAYANVPDGNDIELYKNPDNPKELMFAYTDGKTGDVITKGVITPEKLAAQATGLSAAGFDKAILMAAGGREEKAKAVGRAPAAPRLSDTKQAVDLMQGEGSPLEKAKADWQKKNPDKELPPLFEQVGDLSTHILSLNTGKFTPNEAFKAAQSLYRLDKENPDKADFKVEMPDEGGTAATIKLKSGRSMQLPVEMVDELMNNRAEQIATARKNAETKKAEDAKPGIGQKALDVGAAVADQAVRAIPDELKARAGSAVDAGKRYLTDAATMMVDPAVGEQALAYPAQVAGDAVRRGIGAIRDLRADPNAVPGLE